MKREELAKAIYNAAYITGEFKLRSGITSNEYFDKYQFESNPRILHEIAFQLLPILPKQCEILAGLEMGGIPLATALSLISYKPMILVRKTAKDYGTCKFAEGPDINGKTLLIVEDVVTSGGQIIKSIKELREAGAIIEQAICVIDREQGGKEALAEHGIALHPLFTMTELKSKK
jgi:orotate phosphoribosyltransferase